MKTTPRPTVRVLTAAGILALAVTALPALEPSGLEPTVAIAGLTIQSDQVRIEVRNAGEAAASGTVRLRAVLEDGTATDTEATFGASGGETVFVVLDCGGPVRGILVVGGVLDDGPPFQY